MSVDSFSDYLDRPDISSIDDFLEHYGKKGMKWGVRRSKSQVKTSSDFRQTLPHRGKKPSQLTNKQLKDVNARINLERNYRKMNPTKVESGAKAAKSIIGVLGTAASLYTLVNSPAGKAAISAGKKVIAKKS